MGLREFFSEALEICQKIFEIQRSKGEELEYFSINELRCKIDDLIQDDWFHEELILNSEKEIEILCNFVNNTLMLITRLSEEKILIFNNKENII